MAHWIKYLYCSCYLAFVAACSAETNGGWRYWNPQPGTPFTMDMFVEYYSSVVERCSVAGVSPPQCVQNFKIYAGTTNSTTIVTNGAVVYTNLNTWVVYDKITRTNQFSSFIYTSTNGLSVTTTNTPFLTKEMLFFVDVTAASLLRYFAIHWIADTNSSFETWMSTSNTIYAGYPHEIPFQGFSFAHPSWSITTYQYLGLGYLIHTNPGGNSYSITITKRPEMTGTWSIAEARFYSNSWNTFSLKSFDTTYSNSVKPVVRYIPSGTNAFSPVSLTISGRTLVFLNEFFQSTITNSETISITSTSDVSLANPWHSVSSIVSSNAPANTGDVFVVVYDGYFKNWNNSLATGYGWPGDEGNIFDLGTVLLAENYRLYAENFFERIKLVNAMRWYVPSSVSWYGQKTFSGSGFEPCTEDEEMESVCAVSGSYEVATSTITNTLIGGFFPYMYGYSEQIHYLSCDGYDVGFAVASQYAKGRWNGNPAARLNDSNYSCIAYFYIKRAGIACTTSYEAYTNAGGTQIPATWTNTDSFFSLYGDGSSKFLYEGNTYVLGDDELSDYAYDFDFIEITNAALQGFYEGDFELYNCGNRSHCSIVTTNEMIVTPSWYSLAAQVPSILSVIKYDVPGGFTYVTTNAP